MAEQDVAAQAQAEEAAFKQLGRAAPASSTLRRPSHDAPSHHAICSRSREWPFQKAAATSPAPVQNSSPSSTPVAPPALAPPAGRDPRKDEEAVLAAEVARQREEDEEAAPAPPEVAGLRQDEEVAQAAAVAGLRQDEEAAPAPPEVAGSRQDEEAAPAPPGVAGPRKDEEEALTAAVAGPREEKEQTALPAAGAVPAAEVARPREEKEQAALAAAGAGLREEEEAVAAAELALAPPAMAGPREEDKEAALAAAAVAGPMAAAEVALAPPAAAGPREEDDEDDEEEAAQAGLLLLGGISRSSSAAAGDGTGAGGGGSRPSKDAPHRRNRQGSVARGLWPDTGGDSSSDYQPSDYGPSDDEGGSIGADEDGGSGAGEPGRRAAEVDPGAARGAAAKPKAARGKAPLVLGSARMGALAAAAGSGGAGSRAGRAPRTAAAAAAAAARPASKKRPRPSWGKGEEEGEEEDEAPHRRPKPVAKGEAPSRWSSKYRGVQWHAAGGKWTVRVYLPRQRKKKYVGRFDDEEEGAMAHDRVALEELGSDAELNFPERRGEHELRRRGVGAGPAARGDAPAQAEAKTADQQAIAVEEAAIEAAEKPRDLDRRWRKVSRVKTSKYQGVSKRDKKWRVASYDPVQKKVVYIGTYATEEDAAKAYDVFAKKAYGSEAKLNFP